MILILFTAFKQSLTALAVNSTVIAKLTGLTKKFCLQCKKILTKQQ